MIILSTAVAGGPFIGLLGTVWGVMETFSGIARANAASLTAMAPGVAGALIATVVGLFVAIPAMFAYNYMVTMVRAITQELDAFASEYATAIEHKYVDNRSLVDELREALRPEAKEPSFGGAGLPRLRQRPMKKCSKSHHHALAELNITPLLDLAFVLLVIFIITTTPIVNDLDVDLPSAAKRPKDPKPKVNYVTVESSGQMYLNKDEVDSPRCRTS